MQRDVNNYFSAELDFLWLTAEGGGDLKDLVARLMHEAREKAGMDKELARLIQPEVGHLYSFGTVSAWAKGRSMPPATVLLAACKVTGISIDAALFGEGAVMERLQRVEDALKQLAESQTTDH